MKLNELEHVEGSRISHYRKGRGVGSGNGKTAGAGHKGQKSRSGGVKSPGFEGGQIPLYRRLPKFGFRNISRIEYATVNLSDLNRFKDGSEVTITHLIEEGVVKKELGGLKVLGGGTLERKLIVKAKKFSKSALKAIVDKGGSAEVI